MAWELKKPVSRTSAPGTPPPPLETEGFLPRLGRNVSEEFQAGLGTASRGKLLGIGEENVLQIPMGLMQAATAPITGTARTLGQETLEATGSPAAATAIDVGSQFFLGAGATPLLRAGLRRLPGAPLALRQAGQEAVEAIPGRMTAGRMKSQVLSDQLEQLNPTIGDLPKLRSIAQTIAKEESKLAEFSLESRALIDVAKKTAERLSPTTKPSAILGPGGAPARIAAEAAEPTDFQTAILLQRRIGQRIQSLRRSTAPGATEELGAMKQVAKGLYDDMEHAADQGVGDAYKLLKKRNQLFRREAAVEDLDDIVQRSVRSPEGKDFEEINFGKLRDNLRKLRRKDELFEGSFEKGELDEIDRFLNELRKIPTTGPAKGVAAGSSLFGGRVLGGAAMGKMLGTDPIITAAAVDMSGRAIGAVVSRALTIPKARKLLFSILTAQKSPRMTAETLGLLSAAVRALESEPTTIP